MTHAFFLDAGPLDELSTLHLVDEVRAGHTVRFYGQTKAPFFAHQPLPSFDASAAGLPLRAALYRRKHLASLTIAPQDRVLLLGLTAAVIAPKSWLVERTAIIVNRLPIDVPAGLVHAFVKRSDALHMMVPTQVISKRLQSWGVNEKHIRVALPDIKASIETTQQQPKPFTTPGFLLAVVAPLEANQGLETVIQAIQLAAEIIPDINVFLIGDGADKRRFSWLIRQTHLNNRMHIASNATDYQRFLHHVEICVAPSVIDEGCDPIVLQARARGLAVVATDIPSHAEFIEHGKTGLLYAPGNSHMLCQHLINLYTHKDWLDHYKKSAL